MQQNLVDLQLATSLGINNKVIYTTNIVSRTFMPYLLNACDIYAAPSRLEGFGMPQVEAGACCKPVVSVKAMAMLDTLVHGETALLADVATEIVMKEATVGEESGWEPGHRIVFQNPSTVDYRASVHDLANHLLALMKDENLRRRMGEAGRKRVVENFDYRTVAKKFIQLVSERLGVT